MNALWFFRLAGVTYASVDKGRPADGTRRGQERHLERSDTRVHRRTISTNGSMPKYTGFTQKVLKNSNFGLKNSTLSGVLDVMSKAMLITCVVMFISNNDVRITVSVYYYSEHYVNMLATSSHN